MRAFTQVYHTYSPTRAAAKGNQARVSINSPGALLIIHLFESLPPFSPDQLLIN